MSPQVGLPNIKCSTVMKKHDAPAKKDFTNLKKFVQDDRSHKLANIIANLQFSQHVSQTLRQRLQKKHASQTEGQGQCKNTILEFNFPVNLFNTILFL